MTLTMIVMMQKMIFDITSWDAVADNSWLLEVGSRY